MKATGGEKRPYAVMAFGDLNVDLILSGIRERPKFGGEVLADKLGMHAGGSTANAAACCAQLGLRTLLVTNVGDDSFGDFLIQEMERFGVVTAHILRHSTLNTGITVSLSTRDDRAFVTYLGTIDSLTADDATEELLEQAQHLHVGGYYLQSKLRPRLADVFRPAHDLGLTTSLDTGFDPTEEWDSGLLDILREVDILFPNETEAAGITGHPEPQKALKSLGECCRVVALKVGPDGSMAAADGEVYVAPGLKVEAVDTTGCGDAFDAGFLHEWLAGEGIEECLRLGNACGALIATAPGNAAHLLSEDKLQKLLGH
jgi:sugar/nucleoside kinase (ribokinase family)